MQHSCIQQQKWDLLLRKSYATSKDHNADKPHGQDPHSVISLKGFV